MHGRLAPGKNPALFENISETITGREEDVFRLPLDLGCVFIARRRWRAGQPPFCGRPVVPGRPYCTRHAARCYRAPDAGEAGALR